MGGRRKDVLRVAVAQVCSGTDVDVNLGVIVAGIQNASHGGADLVAFPENAPLLAPEATKLAAAEPLEGRQVRCVREAARALGVHVLLGSFAEAGPDERHTYNTSVLIDRSGALVAVYRKMHLFDVAVDADTTFRESDTVAPGPVAPVVGEVEGWKLGLSICFDLRFPELYRALSAAGADVLCVPSAFTFRTGSAHWEVLLRARAIENTCYLVAPAQVGRHYGQRESWGHAMAVGPWGEVLACCEGGVGLVVAELSSERLERVREQMPSLRHRRQ